MVGPGFAFVNYPALVQNGGIEIVLTTQNIKGNVFKWSTSFNISALRNKLISFQNIELSGFTNKIGEAFYGQTSVFISKGVNLETGRYEFIDLNGESTYRPTLTKNISTEPRFYGGLANKISFKGISLDVLFQFVKQRGRSHLSNYYTIAGAIRNLPVEFDGRWRSPGDHSSIQKVYFSKPPEYSDAANILLASDKNIVDASFIRLKNLSLTYEIPGRWKDKFKISKLSFYMQGQNLLTFTPYKGLDPETLSLSSLPPLRVLTFGLQVAF
jgi:hypothetical protein